MISMKHLGLGMGDVATGNTKNNTRNFPAFKKAIEDQLTKGVKLSETQSHT